MFEHGILAGISLSTLNQEIESQLDTPRKKVSFRDRSK